MKKQILWISLLVTISSSVFAQTKITDANGNIYTSVKIGNQEWLVENLKTTHFNNGDPIPNITDKYAWNNLQTAAYCDYKNNPENSIIQGRLYNWYAIVDPREIAPKGWRVATREDWEILSEYLGKEYAGDKLKAVGGDWKNNVGATNETGFTALPGYRRVSYEGMFSEDYGYGVAFWNATESSTGRAYTSEINYSFSYIRFMADEKCVGLPVRCVR